MTKRPGTSLTLFLLRRCPGDEVRTLVEATEQRGVVQNIPDAVLDLLEPDGLVVEGLTEEVLTRV